MNAVSLNTEDFLRRAQQAADLLKLLSNERRLMILCQLTTGEKSVGELEALVGLRQSALSQHLAKLRLEGVVATRRESQHIYYTIADEGVVEIIETLAGLYCPLPDDDSPPKEYSI